MGASVVEGRGGMGWAPLAAALVLAACRGGGEAPVVGRLLPPPPPPEAWAGLVGEYANGADTLSLLENEGKLHLLFWTGPGRPGRPEALEEGGGGRFVRSGAKGVDTLWIEEGEGVGVRAIRLEGRRWVRIFLGEPQGGTFRIVPRRPLEELRAEALASTPPVEEGDFLPSDLVELTALDPALRLDIRYAGTDNFLGAALYSSPRAFLQRPAAEALVRAHEWLKTQGYGLVIFDGYRPWYVTKMFWEATPPHLRDFVADPAQGSRHNRGCAVDLTLVDLATGEVVEMPGGYDEMSPRSHVDYPGGTARQRWFRDLLRRAMEAQGFQVYPAEWWHFDYRDWRRYRIENRTFEELG